MTYVSRNDKCTILVFLPPLSASCHVPGAHCALARTRIHSLSSSVTLDRKLKRDVTALRASRDGARLTGFNDSSFIRARGALFTIILLLAVAESDQVSGRAIHMADISHLYRWENKLAASLVLKYSRLTRVHTHAAGKAARNKLHRWAISAGSNIDSSEGIGRGSSDDGVASAGSKNTSDATNEKRRSACANEAETVEELQLQNKLSSSQRDQWTGRAVSAERPVL